MLLFVVCVLIKLLTQRDKLLIYETLSSAVVRLISYLTLFERDLMSFLSDHSDSSALVPIFFLAYFFLLCLSPDWFEIFYFFVCFVRASADRMTTIHSTRVTV